MDGYYDKEGTLRIDVTNITEFNELLKKAQLQIQELENTIIGLSTFQLKIKFKVDE